MTKINRLKKDGIGNLHLLLDFDRTISVSKHGKDRVSQWHAMRQHLTADEQKQCENLFRIYRPLEVSGQLTVEQSRDWNSAELNLMVKFSLDLNAVEQNLINHLTLRPGVVELFKFCETHEVPIVILSSGIKNVIDMFLRSYGIKSTLTIATELEVNDKGILVGWKKSTLVHNYNKRESAHSELKQIRLKQPNCILVGDSLHDAAMTNGDDNHVAK